MDEKYHTETVEDHTPEGYTARIQRNKHIPERFKEPLTIINFSLMPEVKKRLEKRLKPFVDGTKNEIQDAEELKKLIEDNFPKQALDYFRTLDLEHPEKIPPHVYVIKNLPEIADKWFLSHGREESCAYWIGKGFALATNMKHVDAGKLDRDAGPNFPGGNAHKHNVTATALSGIYQKEGTRTATRFVDLVGARDDAHREFIGGAPEIPLPLDNYLRPGAQEFNDYMLENHYMRPEKLKGYSNEVVIEKGDMALWSEHGRIFHQALRTECKEGVIQWDHGVVRIIMPHDFKRENNSSPTR